MAALLVACDEPAAPPLEASRGAPLRDTASGPARDVVLITIDTLRADALGFAGNSQVSTPNLDRLAADGTIFTRAHAHNVVTLPSHANILTGRLPFEHGIRDNTGFVLGPTWPTAATLFQEAGFATAAVVAAFPLDARFGLDRGFDLYDDQLPIADGARFRSTERRGDAVVARARDWWRDHAEQRRFLWIHLFEPHAPYEPIEPFRTRFQDAPYLGEVATVDAYLAPLLEPFLRGEEKPALVVLTADHGESLGEHGEATHGLFAYEATLRVPLVLWGAGVAKASTETPARHIDLLPTMLDATGLALPNDLPGRSLLGTDRTNDDEAEAITYFEALSANLDRGWAPLRGVIQDDDKLIELPLLELYDLATDPDELDNRFDRDRRRLAGLRALLPAESVWPPQRAVATSNEERAALRSLGYTAGRAAPKARYTAEDDPKRLVAVDQAVHRFIDRYERGQLTEATELARALVDEQPHMALAHENLAQVLLERDQIASAIAAMTRAHELGAASPALERQRALSLLQVGRAEDALAVALPLRDSDDPENLDTVGMILAEAGRPEEARVVLERSLTLDATNPIAEQHLALAALRLEDWAEASRRAERAVAGSDRLANAWNYLGVARANLGQPQGAIQAWQRAVEIEPDDLDLIYNIAVVAVRIGDRASAIDALERFIATAPAERYARDIEQARQMLARLRGQP